MLSAFSYLFTPLRLGPVEVKNRIFSSGHMTMLLNDGGVPVAVIGDCLCPRTVEEAVYEGMVAGLEV